MSEGRHTTVAEELKSGKSVTIFTVGVSMEPLLSQRRTYVTLVPPVSFRTGDILLYLRENGSYVLHRCIRRRDGICYMRGDNTYGLEPIPEARVIGVVTHICRGGKTFAVEKNVAYKAYVCLWRILYPVRWFFFRVRHIPKKIRRTWGNR